LVLSLFFCAGVLVPAAAFQDPPAPRTVFSSQSEVVLLNVAVLDRKDAFVSGLPVSAFTVYENNQPQTVTFFENQDHPVTVGLVIDCSGSMQRKRAAVIEAGLAFAKSSHPEDEMFTVNFNEHVWMGLPPQLSYTSRIGELEDALQRSTAVGQTALFDAMHVSLAHLGKGHRQKKVLIVVTDGADNASTARFEDVLNEALRMDAVIYTIGLADEFDRGARPKLLKRIAAETGAEAYFPHDPGEATRILERIARDIRSGYTLGYVPVNHGGAGYRAIRVEVRSPDRRKLSVRARSGYLAGPPVGNHD
jgi:VWFA-related protein